MGILKFIKNLFGGSKEETTLPVVEPVVTKTKVQEPITKTVVEATKVEEVKVEQPKTSQPKVEKPKAEVKKVEESTKTAKEIKAKVRKPDNTEANKAPQSKPKSRRRKPKSKPQSGE